MLPSAVTLDDVGYPFDESRGLNCVPVLILFSPRPPTPGAPFFSTSPLLNFALSTLYQAAPVAFETACLFFALVTLPVLARSQAAPPTNPLAIDAIRDEALNGQ